MFDQLLFVLHDPTDRNGDDLGKIVRRVSCRIVRPLEKIAEDSSRSFDESVDAAIISMCVEPIADDKFSGPFKGVFHVCARCGAEMRENVRILHPSWQDWCAIPSGGTGTPRKVREFLGTMGYDFQPIHASLL